MQEVRGMVQKLKNSPSIGKIAPLFNGRTKTYRSVNVNGLNKFVYYIEDDIIHIAVFWDTRMEPLAQAAKAD